MFVGFPVLLWGLILVHQSPYFYKTAVSKSLSWNWWLFILVCGVSWVLWCNIVELRLYARIQVSD